MPRRLQVVANVTAAELARRLEKEGVVVLSFFAGGRAGAGGVTTKGKLC